MTRHGGFSLIELLIAMSIVLSVTAAVFTLLNPAHGAFLVEPEAADLQQRVRNAADTLFRDLLSAVPPVVPYRRGAVDPDPPGSFRDNTITVALALDPPPAPLASRTYHLKPAGRSGVPQLMRYNGAASDVPVIDHVVGLSFTYFVEEAGAIVPLDRTRLADGPWIPNSSAADRFDADLLRIRTIRVQLRVEAASDALRGPSNSLFQRPGRARGARFLPDQILEFDVTPRNDGPQS